MKRSLKKVLGIILTLALVVTLLPGNTAEAATKPALNKNTSNVLIGKTYDFNIKYKIAGSTYRWTTSDKSVATVSKVGLVKGIKKGTAKITCTITAGKKNYSLTATVTIVEPAKSIKINNKIKTLIVGDTYDLNRTLSPKSSNDKTTWTSSDKTIVNPDKNGKIVGLKAGKVTVKAKTLSGKSDSVTIEVVKGEDLIVNADDVVKGTVKLTNKIYNDITIRNNVGDAKITLSKVKVTGTLYMESGSDYQVDTLDCNIANVAVVTPEITSMSIDKDKIPTFIAGAGSVVVHIDANGNIHISQSAYAKITSITVTPDATGKLVISLDGFKGDITINSELKNEIIIETTNCKIGTANITGAKAGSTLSFVDKYAGTDKASSIKSVKVEADIALTLDVKTTEVTIAANTKKVELVVKQPVGTVVNNGSNTIVTTEGKGKIDKTSGKPTASITPTPAPGAGGGFGGGGNGGGNNGGGNNGGSNPPADDSPGIDVSNGVYTFDEHVTGFTINVGNKSYPLTVGQLALIALDWENEPTYTVPNTSNSLILKRTNTSYTYDVEVVGVTTFRMVVDPTNLRVSVSGGTGVTITNVVRTYTFDSSFTGLTLSVGNNTYEITKQMLYEIGTAWDNNERYHTVQSLRNLRLERVSLLSTYKVTVPGYRAFTMSLNIPYKTITVTDGTDVAITNTVRRFSFASDVTGFTVTIPSVNPANSKSYVIDKQEVLDIVGDWNNNVSSYPISGSDITLHRTSTPFLYEVEVSDTTSFMMQVNVLNRSITVSGGTNFNITNIN
jgi:uncharacterized protein YjdB